MFMIKIICYFLEKNICNVSFLTKIFANRKFTITKISDNFIIGDYKKKKKEKDKEIYEIST